MHRKISCILLSLLMIISMCVPVWADTNDVQTISGNSASGNLIGRTQVVSSVASSFFVIIPKTITLDSVSSTADYVVTVKGDILGSEKISVVPNSTFVMTSAGKSDVVCSVTQPTKEFTIADGVFDGCNAGGHIATSDGNPLTAGDWEGIFVFTISKTSV